MRTTKETHDYILDCLQRAGEVTTRRMMGEYCVYCAGKLVGQIFEGSLYLKETPSVQALLAGCPREYPHGAKAAWYRADCFEDIPLMRELLARMVTDLTEPKKSGAKRREEGV